MAIDLELEWEHVADGLCVEWTKFQRARLSETDEPLTETNPAKLAVTASALRDAIYRCATYTCPKNQAEKATMAGQLRELAGKTGSPWLIKAAADLATRVEIKQDRVGFWQAYRIYGPIRAARFGTVREDDRQALWDAAEAAKDFQPLNAAQLGEKLRIAATIGVHRTIKGRLSIDGLSPRWFLVNYRTVYEKMPFWFFLDAIDFDPEEAARRPAKIGRADRGFVREMIDSAGPDWAASLTADIGHLRRMSVTVA